MWNEGGRGAELPRRTQGPSAAGGVLPLPPGPHPEARSSCSAHSIAQRWSRTACPNPRQAVARTLTPPGAPGPPLAHHSHDWALTPLVICGRSDVPRVTLPSPQQETHLVHQVAGCGGGRGDSTAWTPAPGVFSRLGSSGRSRELRAGLGARVVFLERKRDLEKEGPCQLLTQPSQGEGSQGGAPPPPPNL